MGLSVLRNVGEDCAGRRLSPKNALDPSPVQLENRAPLPVNRAEHPVIVYSSLFGACKMTSPLWLMEMKVVAPVIEWSELVADCCVSAPG